MSKPSLKNFLPLLFSLIFIGTLALTLIIIKKSGYHITYSATSSMPKGFYLITPVKRIKYLDIVEFTPPSSILNFVKEKHWIPESGLIIKYVFALPNDHVCIKNEALWINNKKTCPVYKFYDQNKLLPQAKICGTLKEDQYLLLSTENERSFDSRYFGTISLQKISGRAVPIFTY